MCQPGVSVCHQMRATKLKGSKGAGGGGGGGEGQKKKKKKKKGKKKERVWPVIKETLAISEIGAAARV